MKVKILLCVCVLCCVFKSSPIMPGMSGCVGMYVHGLHLCVCDCMSRCMYIVCLFAYSCMLMPGMSGCVDYVHMYLVSPSVIMERSQCMETYKCSQLCVGSGGGV